MSLIAADLPICLHSGLCWLQAKLQQLPVQPVMTVAAAVKFLLLVWPHQEAGICHGPATLGAAASVAEQL